MEAMTRCDSMRILGLRPGATATDVKKAYHASALKNHPDKGGNPEVMKQVVRAYEILIEVADSAAESPPAPPQTRRHTVSEPSPPPCNAIIGERVAQARVR